MTIKKIRTSLPPFYRLWSCERLCSGPSLMSLLMEINSPNRQAVHGFVNDSRSTFNGRCMYFLVENILSVTNLDEQYAEDPQCFKYDRSLFGIRYARANFFQS